jgi:hypothetical protein
MKEEKYLKVALEIAVDYIQSRMSNVYFESTKARNNANWYMMKNHVDLFKDVFNIDLSNISFKFMETKEEMIKKMLKQ